MSDKPILAKTKALIYLSAQTRTIKTLYNQAYSFQKNALNFAISAELPIFVAVRKHFLPMRQDANPMIQRQVVFFLFQARHEKNANFRVHSMVVKLQVIIFARKNNKNDKSKTIYQVGWRKNTTH